MNENQAQTDDAGSSVDVGAVVMVGVVSLMVLAIVIVSSWAWFNALRFEEEERQIVEAPYAELENLQMDQRIRLASYGWVDQSKGKAHIPIERAMSIYARSSRAGSDKGAESGESP